MAKKNKKKPAAKNPKAPLPTGEGNILDRELVFSFKFYDENNEKKFCLSNFDQNQVRSALERLRELNRTTIKDLRAKKTFYNFHEVYWDQTIIKRGFKNNGLKELEPFQFSLANVNGQKTRVFGAMSGFTFYIVWFDLNHLIWPSFKKHT